MITQSTNQNIKSSQFRFLIILVIIVGICLIGMILFLQKHNEAKKVIRQEKPVFVSSMAHIDTESFILEKTQKQLRDTESKTALMQQQIDSLLHEKKAVDSAQQSTDALVQRVAELENKLNDASGKESQHAVSDVYAENVRIREDILSLNASSFEKQIPLKNPDTYVPSGTFAKAVMIGGADASAAVNSSVNPVPMLFRIVANGTLPNHKKSHLKDCVVTAAAVGDISSERGLIRLEHLSCTFPNNEVVDQAVEGTIFGPEGKNGVRGIPVWRESALLQRAFAAGALSGISDGISQTYTANSISPQGAVQTINSGKVLQYGAANGAGKAMDKLAEYNIQRAEQYHPVIQLSAGTVVDVVFLKGFYLDGQKHEEQDKKPYRNLPLLETASNTPTLFPGNSGNSMEAQALPLSEREVKRIQENSKALGLKVTNLPTVP
jgi:conjugal transfer pilus assembly protein TraB